MTKGMTKNEELHSEALGLLKRINSEIPDKKRIEVLNTMMRGVIRELNGQLIDNIIPKPIEDDSQ